ncbi:Acyl-CoA dehydrogenase, short-chain specific [Sphingobacterium spiritivorum]|uniref:Acyl-CoA dehydrogenase, short-chain specific n=1 Tax=Sphingobacterium spiritivorum TaxID=258 RepID=A0A380BBT3_SPHSI|nr:acyl-CoA dehydrogenase family protein [Sphingobacterium spiritivorum]SUI98202.1 Acyl-CoA dehydrogenase, short-chain specific [Sphingobacterium spiritivorum]
MKEVDYFQIDELLTEEQLMIRNTVREFVNKEILPVIDGAAQQHKDIPGLMQKLGAIGALGPYIPQEYGGAGLDQLSYGLIMQELEAGDSAVRSAASVQSSLVMFPIYTYGSEEQKRKFLPKLATGEWIGSFGLTEPNHGSDPAAMETRLSKDGDGYILNGAKMWITNAPVCDLAVVWARDDEGKVRGIIVEREMKGFTTPETHNKWSLRASKTGELIFEDVRIPQANILPDVSSMKGPLSCLNSARYGISWGVIGAAVDCYQTALRYSLERQQFGKPVASYQLQQKKLAEFLTEITKAQLLSWRLGVLKNEGKATPQQISMAKRNNVNMALQIARESRQMLGAMGIVGEFPIMRHMMNLESVITYEGTHDIHLLITGQDITGISAF